MFQITNNFKSNLSPRNRKQLYKEFNANSKAQAVIYDLDTEDSLKTSRQTIISKVQ